MTSFQADAGRQGRQFAEQCDGLLQSLGFTLMGREVFEDVGVEVDQVAMSPSATEIWFEYKGSLAGNRPGLLRTDTVKKAIANGALLQQLPQRHPYVVLTSHVPDRGAAAAMLRTAVAARYISHVICVYDPEDATRLKQL